ITFWQYFFLFQAEDGIRDFLVTGVQTCALPICEVRQVLVREREGQLDGIALVVGRQAELLGQPQEGAGDACADGHLGLVEHLAEIGRATCRETCPAAKHSEANKITTKASDNYDA